VTRQTLRSIFPGSRPAHVSLAFALALALAGCETFGTGTAGPAEDDTTTASRTADETRGAESDDNAPAGTAAADQAPDADVTPPSQAAQTPGAPARAGPGEGTAPADPQAEAEADGEISLTPPDEVGPRRQSVGLLLPLSGPKAPLGESMLRAAEMALFDVADSRFELVVRDTGGTPKGARDAARAAVDAGANLLLGPVFSSSVKAVKPVAEGARVPVLAFSNNPAVAEPGIYVLGLMPQQQVRRIVSYAASRGKRRFAVLAPRNAYGELVVKALREATGRYGGQVAGIAFYEPGSQDVSDQVKRLAESGFGSQPGSAVLMPAGGKQLQTIAPTFPFHDIDPEEVQFLGTVLWNDPMLGTEPALVGGWFPAPAPKGQERFNRRYRRIYAGPPGDLSSLAYDATALAALLARRGGTTDAATNGAAVYSTERLTQPNGFVGTDGVFRLKRDGTVQRLYAVMEMQRKALKVIDPAPESFQQLLN